MFDRIRRFFAGEPTAAAVRGSMMFAGRARLITHLLEAWGEEGAVEHGFDGKPSGYEPLLVFEVAPQGERQWWTYTTAGLSLCPALDGKPPMELLAYAEDRSRPNEDDGTVLFMAVIGLQSAESMRSAQDEAMRTHAWRLF